MKTILTLILILSSFSLYAQEHKGQRQERITTLKVGFLTERLNLNSKEAQDFWPIYNAFDKKMENLRSSEFEALHTYKQDSATISDQKAQDILTTILDTEQKRTEHKTQLAQDLKKVMSVKKVLALFKAEEDFKRKLLRELRKRRQER